MLLHTAHMPLIILCMAVRDSSAEDALPASKTEKTSYLDAFANMLNFKSGSASYHTRPTPSSTGQHRRQASRAFGSMNATPAATAQGVPRPTGKRERTRTPPSSASNLNRGAATFESMSKQHASHENDSINSSAMALVAPLPPSQLAAAEAAIDAQLRAGLSNIFAAIITGKAYHATRCRFIKLTWLTQMSAGHYMFYSDADDASLPAKKVLSMSKGNARDRSQRKWAPALVDAWTLSRQLRTTWTLVVDDDTFVAPRNVMRVLADYDAQADVVVAQLCPLYQGVRTMCGGAGWAMTSNVHRKLVSALPGCERDYFINGEVHREGQSDRFLGRCLLETLRVPITDRREFGSQPPLFYETALGKRDKPDGYGRAATFHYVSAARQKALAPTLTDEDYWMGVHRLVEAGRR